MPRDMRCILCARGQATTRCAGSSLRASTFTDTHRDQRRDARAYLSEYAVAIIGQLRLALGLRLRRRIDVVHICNPPDLLFLVALPLVALGARLRYDHHDAVPELMVAKGAGARLAGPRGQSSRAADVPVR